MKELKPISKKRENRNQDISPTQSSTATELISALGKKSVRNEPKYPFHKIAQFRGEHLPEQEIVIAAAPDMEQPVETNWLTLLASPIGIAVVMMIMILVTGTISPAYLMFTVPMAAVSMSVSILNQQKQSKTKEKSQKEKETLYLNYLHECEDQLKEVTQKQYSILNRENPPVQTCLSIQAGNELLWNRSPRSDSFMTVRLGVGSMPICVPVKLPEKRYDRQNPLEEQAHSLAARYSTITNIPKTVDLKKHSSMVITGERAASVSQAQALIVNATAMHSYEDMRLAVIYPRDEAAQWESVRWLPHVYDEKRTVRLVADKPATAKRLLSQIKSLIEDRTEELTNSHWRNHVASPHYLIVIADMSCVSAADVHALTVNNPALSISTVFLSDLLPQGCQIVLEAQKGNNILYNVKTSNQRESFIADLVSNTEFADYCHSIAPIHIEQRRASSEVPLFASFLDLWSTRSPEKIPIVDNWGRSLPSESMEVPIGMSADGVFHFNIHQHAHGPHGMYVGTTGSGKTSMVRSWILSMAVQFSPEYVNFVLVDFKGSSLLDGLQNLPHVVGTISSLDSDISRNLLALESEIKRRQAFFKKHGGDIYKCYEAGIRAIPFLYIVIDELNEFKIWSNSGDLNQMKLLDRLAQVGRGLGIHLIAGSQDSTPFTNIMQQNARFRWCLKTAQKEDSRYLLQTEDGFNITNKGRAIMRVGNNEVYEELQPAYSDGNYFSEQDLKSIPEREMALLDLQGNKRYATVKNVSGNETQLDIIVSLINHTATASNKKAPRQIWPERLPDRLYLWELQKPEENELTATVGLVDDPVAQQQYALFLDLKRTGHVVIYGAPQTGKTTFLITTAISLMSACSPDRLSMYLLGNGDIETLKVCPHVRKTANSFAPKPVIGAVHQELMRRKQKGMSTGDKTIVLMIDGFGQFAGDFRTELVDIAQFGPGCGIYIIASAANGTQVSCISAYLTRGYALWYTNTVFSYRSDLLSQEISRIPPKGIPGRAIFHQERTLEFQIALPYSTNAQRDALLEEICRKYQGYHSDQMHVELEPGSVLLGWEYGSDCPVYQNFHEITSLLILGDDLPLRRDLLINAGQQLAKQPDLFQTVTIDLQQDQIQKFPDAVYLNSGQEVDDYLQDIFEELRRRHDESEKDPTMSFPKYVFLIDDWNRCISKANELSEKRFALNCLLNGARYGIQMIAGCSQAQYEKLFEQDIIGASQMLGAGCGILLGKQFPIPPCFAEQMNPHQEDSGNFFISPKSAVKMVISDKSM